MNAATSLYRHFAADGTLLYVGISLSWPMRTKAHANGSPWFNEVASVTIEQFTTRDAALEAEREAIRRERPKFNVVHNHPRATSQRSAPQKTNRGLSTGPLGYITGPCALVGPALVYRDNFVSVLVAWGTPGTSGEITEIVLGELGPDIPEWANACVSVSVLLQAGEITMEEARHMRMKIVRELASRVSKVDAFETDLALAKAYAERFPGEDSERVLREVSTQVAA